LAAWGEPSPPRRPLGGNEQGGSDSASSWDNCYGVPRSKRAKRKSKSYLRADEKAVFGGITGTNGKTNTEFLIESILREGSNVTEPTDAEVRDILVHAMADVGADPALVYAFQKTGVYVCDENEKRLPKEKLKAFDGAVDEYLAALKRPAQ
jgi:hypothetical protein